MDASGHAYLFAVIGNGRVTIPPLLRIRRGALANSNVHFGSAPPASFIPIDLAMTMASPRRRPNAGSSSARFYRVPLIATATGRGSSCTWADFRTLIQLGTRPDERHPNFRERFGSEATGIFAEVRRPT